jgi:hypothetical protein
MGGRFNSFARGAGRMFERGLRSGIKGLTYQAPKQKKGPSNFSSAYLTKKRPYMSLEKGKSIISGMHASKHDKILTQLRLENKLYDSSKKDDPHFSRNEANQAIARTRELYGDRVASDVEKRLQTAFMGRHTISPSQAEKYLASINQYGPHVKEGVKLITRNYNPTFQGGVSGKYITNEKLEKAIEETRTHSGKYVAHSMERKFMVSHDNEGNKPGQPGKSVNPLLGWKISSRKSGWGVKKPEDTGKSGEQNSPGDTNK